MFSDEEVLRVEATYPDAKLSIVVGSRRVAIENVSKPIKFGLYIQITGHAKSPEAAIDQFLPPASGVLATLAFSMNASVGELEPELAFDSTLGREARPFLRNYLSPAEFIPLPPRTASPELVVAVLNAITAHPRHERLHRAVAQYFQALQHWRPGHETLALSHLWMGIEALTPVIRDAYLEQHKVTREQLLQDWGIELKEFDSEVRRRLVFRDDSDTYAKARSASDGFEHGYKNLDEILELSLDVSKLTAGYLRQALLETLTIESGFRQTLLSSPFNEPLALHLAKYLRGLILRSTGSFNAPGRPYPEILWVMKFRDGVPDSPEKVGIVVDDQITPSLSPDAGIANLRIEAWAQRGVGDAGSIRVDPVTWRITKPREPSFLQRLLDRVKHAFART